MARPTKPTRGSLVSIPPTGDMNARQLTAAIRELQKRVEQLTTEQDARYSRDTEVATAVAALRNRNQGV